MTEIALTAEELDLIHKKREEEEAKAKAEKEKREAQIQRMVEFEAKKVQEAEEYWKKQNEAAEAYAEEFLKNDFEKVVEPRFIPFIVKNEKGEEVWRADRNFSKTLFKKGKYEVEVVEHISYQGSRYYRDTATSKGFKLYSLQLDSTRYYSRAKTIIEKINTEIKTENWKKVNVNKLESSAREVTEQLKEKFSEAEVKLELDWDYGYRDGRRTFDTPERTATILVTFPNELKVKYKVYKDKSMSISILKYPVKLPELVEMLRGVQVTQE